MFTTFRYRIKNKETTLFRLAAAVNFVWNYCNETNIESIKKHGKVLSGFDLCYKTARCSKDLGLRSSTIQEICQEHCRKRDQFKVRKLSWRSSKRSLGWVPFKSDGVVVKGDAITYYGHHFRFWNSRSIEGEIKCGSFNADSRGRWYINFTCEVPDRISQPKTGKCVGIDLGLKTLMTLSNGTKIENPRQQDFFDEKLRMAHRANKKRLRRTILAKITNYRTDFLHKVTNEIIGAHDDIFIGDVRSIALAKTHLSKSVNDASWGTIKFMLAYKAVRLGVNYKMVNENLSTVTCSSCKTICGPKGLSNMGVRNWICEVCGATHDRDVNAAINILNFGLGHQSPKGVSLRENVNRQGTGN